MIRKSFSFKDFLKIWLQITTGNLFSLAIEFYFYRIRRILFLKEREILLLLLAIVYCKVFLCIRPKQFSATASKYFKSQSRVIF